MPRNLGEAPDGKHKSLCVEKARLRSGLKFRRMVHGARPRYVFFFFNLPKKLDPELFLSAAGATGWPLTYPAGICAMA